MDTRMSIVNEKTVRYTESSCIPDKHIIMDVRKYA